MFEVIKNFTLGTPIQPGSYRMEFSYPVYIPAPPPPSLAPFSKAIGNWVYDVSDWRVNYQTRRITFILVVSKNNPEVNEAAVPFNIVLVAVAGIAGLVLVFLTLEKVEKLIEGPAGASVLGIGIVLAIAALVYVFRKDFQ